MPRRSNASFSVVSPTGTPPWLEVPAELIGKARKIFLDTVGSLKPGHFQPSDRPLLAEYCRCCALAEQAHAMLAAEGAVVASPQGRSPTIPSRPLRPLSVYERMNLEGDDGAA
jgi:hypothetical protein